MAADPGPPPPSPGPRPQPFVFPFAECRAAIDALSGLQDELTTLLNRHDLNVDDALRDFAGSTADDFRDAYDTGTEALEGSRTWARNQRELLEEQLALAQEARATRQEEIATWQQNDQAYSDWQRDVAAAS